MPFLTLNGWQIPVSGGEIEPREVGGQRRSQNGSMFVQRVAVKRRWRFTTAPMTFSDAHALMGLVLGEGQRWQFTPGTFSQVYDDDAACASETGLIPSLANDSTVESTRGADGRRAVTLVTAPSTYRENDWVGGVGGSLACELPTTNLLPASQRDCEDTPSTDFVNINSATLADETTFFWQGSKSLKVTTTAGVIRGASTSLVAVSGSTDYVGSVYVQGASGGETVSVWLVEGGGPTTQVDVVLPAAGSWCRIWVKRTTSVGATQMRLQVVDTNVGDAQTFYCDGWQFEQQNHTTQWVDGTRSVLGGLSYPPGPVQVLNSHSVAAWVTGSTRPTGDPSNPWIHNFKATLSQSGFTFNAANNKLRAFLVGPGGLNYLIVDSPNLLDANWHHVVMVYDADAPSLTIYEDGSQVAQVTTPTGPAPNFESAPSFQLADVWAGTEGASGINIGELQLAPYAMPAAQVAGLASAGLPYPALPQMLASGDFFERDVIVVGRVSRSSYLGVQRTTWENNNLRVSFELEEV